MTAKTFVAALGILIVTEVSAQAPAPALDGTKDAVAAADRLLETLGGRDAWAGARSAMVILRGQNATEAGPWAERYWIDLVVPRGRYEIDTGPSRRVIGWTSAKAWEFRDGTMREQSAAELAVERGYWAAELMVVLRRLAAATPATRVALDTSAAGLRALLVLEPPSDSVLAMIALNAIGEPVRWEARLGARHFQRVLGPLASYGSIRYPQWGTTPSGSWRYEHLRVELSPMVPTVSFDRP